jgi:hypothetical protein
MTTHSSSRGGRSTVKESRRIHQRVWMYAFRRKKSRRLEDSGVHMNAPETLHVYISEQDVRKQYMRAGECIREWKCVHFGAGGWNTREWRCVLVRPGELGCRSTV